MNTGESKMRVLLLRGGRMGEIAKATLDQIPNIEVIEEDLNEWTFPLWDMVFSASYPKRIDLNYVGDKPAVNIHTSLLPEGRGSNPLNWALIWGKDKTGITIHKVAESYDAGDICLQKEVEILDSYNIVSLRERIEAVFPDLIREFFKDPLTLIANARQQNQAEATYAQKRVRGDSQINPNAPMKDVRNLFRACHPVDYPAFVVIDGHKFKVTDVSIENGIITAGHM